MASPRVSSVALKPLTHPGEAEVRVEVTGGKPSVFRAATFERPCAWVATEKGGYWFGEPVLFVKKLDQKTVKAAVDAMAAELGGYWLRYYRSAPGSPSKVGLGTARADRVEGGSGVVEAVLKDGREFSMLAATPRWWAAELDRLESPFYFGPLTLFLAAVDDAHARRAAKAMAERDEQLFCRYDTPRRSLPDVLAEYGGAKKR